MTSPKTKIMDNIKEKVCSLNELCKAYCKCKRNVSWKDSVITYGMTLLSRVRKLQEDIFNENYDIQKYQRFTIYEPKQRLIVSTRIRDRVFQKSLCDNYLYKEITKHFIYDNCACQIRKGTDFARKRLITHIERFYRKYGNNGYVLQCDIKSFYDSIDHDVAKQVIRKMIDDDFAYNSVANIIDSYDKGIGLGSQISQLIALSMLNDLDHLIKDKLRVRFYVRYADDFLLIFQKKEQAITALCSISKELSSKKLSLNKKKTQIYPLARGIHFLGFRYKTLNSKLIITRIKLKITRTKHRIRKQLLSGYPYIQLLENIKHLIKGLLIYKCYKDIVIIKTYLEQRRISYVLC